MNNHRSNGKLRVFDPLSLGLTRFKMVGENEVLACCPFHGDSTPSMSVNLTNGMFFCYACGAKGNAQLLAKELGGRVSIKSLVSPPSHSFDDDDIITMWMKNKPASAKNEYLSKRGVTKSDIEIYDIRETKSSIVFPLRMASGKVVGVMMRQIKNNVRFGKYFVIGEKPPIYPAQFLEDDDAEMSVLVEGIFGVIRGRKAGFSVYSSLGVNVKKSIEPYLLSRNWIIAFDDDSPGYISAAKVMKKYPERISVMLPGAEMDELSEVEWSSALESQNLTHQLLDISAFSGIPQKEFFKKVL